MSFRARLLTFFVLIVVVPMVAMGVLMFRLISDSQQGKADARAGGLASAAASLYQSEAALARSDAETLARAVGHTHGQALATHFETLAKQAGLARATVTAANKTVVDVGDKSAIAPGSAVLVQPGSNRRMTVAVSELTASQYVRELSAADAAVVVRKGPKILGASFATSPAASLPNGGNVSLNGHGYRAVGQSFAGFDHAPITVTTLSALSA